MMDLVEIFKALANNKRLEILNLLKEPEKYFLNDDCQIKNGGVCIKSIEQRVNLSQSTVSHYVNILYKVKLIEFERIGQWTYCKINNKTLLFLNEQIGQMINLHALGE